MFKYRYATIIYIVSRKLKKRKRLTCEAIETIKNEIKISMKYSVFWFLFSLTLLLPFEVHHNKQAYAQPSPENSTVENIIDNIFTIEGDNYFSEIYPTNVNPSNVDVDISP